MISTSRLILPSPTSLHQLPIEMKAALRLYATPTAVSSTKGLKPAPLALLPPIPLYRRLFRTHRQFLPKEMRLLGDEYIKSEFRAHQKIDNPMHIVSARNAEDLTSTANLRLRLAF